MKTSISSKAKATASALLTALIICSIFSLFVVYYLTFIEQQNSLSSRSQTWNMAMAITEAGVEEGLQHLNANYRQLGTDNWTAVDYNVYYRSNALPDGNAYTIYLTNGAAPVIVARAYVKGLTLAQNTPLGFFATVGANTAPTVVTRAVKVVCTRNNLFTAVVAVKGNIELNGNGVYTDSYHSGDPTKSTYGQYDENKYTGDFGDISTNGGITNSVDVQNGNIYGKVHTGPNCPVSVGPNGGVGTHSWQKTHHGFENGYVLSDANFTFPDTTFPNTASYIEPTGGTVDGTNYDNIIYAGTHYVSSSFSGKTLVLPNPSPFPKSTTAYLALPNGSSAIESITIAPGANLRVYWGGTSFSMAGNQVVNANGYAGSFAVYCAPTITSFELTLAGNSRFIGIVAAPYTDLSLKGSGNEQIDFCGALVGKSLTLNGHYSFHYDEALGVAPPNGRFLISSWDEVP